VLSLVACTFNNRATFAVESPSNGDALVADFERYLSERGLRLQKKIDFEYPEQRKERRYFLGRTDSRIPINTYAAIPLDTAFSYVQLRLEQSGILFVDWIRISDRRYEPKPEHFEAVNAKIASDLKSRFGVDVRFNFIEPGGQAR
jgi:hypothetical protein